MRPRRRPCIVRSLVAGAAMLLLLFAAAAPTRVEAAGASVVPHRGIRDALEGWTLYVRIDFGDPKDRTPGSQTSDGRIPTPHVALARGMVRAVTRPDRRDPWTRDFLEGEDAELVLPLNPGGRYRVLLSLGDPDAARGPLAVFLEDELLAAGIATAAGEVVDVDFTVDTAGERLRLRIAGDDCRPFAVSGLAVYVPSSSGRRKPATFFSGRRVPVLDAAPPPIDRAEEKPAGAALLERMAAYLVSARPREGCFSGSGNWYETSYPVRTLLAAARVHGRPEWRSDALTCVDRFAAEQHLDGSWASEYFGSASCPEALAAAAESGSRNLADVGTMAICLSLAAAGSAPDDSTRYVTAARRYADQVVLPNQLSSGAFPNLQFEGSEYRHPYSVATAVQAANLSALAAVTGDARYRTASERAARFLASSILQDGSVEFYPYNTDSVRVVDPERLGDLFYVLEGLFWGRRAAGAEGRREIDLALDRYFAGPGGLRAWAAPYAWMSKESAWENSKRAGFLGHLALYRSLRGPSPLLDDWIHGLLEALASPEHATAAGVMAGPGMLRTEYSHVATGFAGVGVSALLDPDLLFP